MEVMYDSFAIGCYCKPWKDIYIRTMVELRNREEQKTLEKGREKKIEKKKKKKTKKNKCHTLSRI